MKKEDKIETGEFLLKELDKEEIDRLSVPVAGVKEFKESASIMIRDEAFRCLLQGMSQNAFVLLSVLLRRNLNAVCFYMSKEEKDFVRKFIRIAYSSINLALKELVQFGLILQSGKRYSFNWESFAYRYVMHQAPKGRVSRRRYAYN